MSRERRAAARARNGRAAFRGALCAAGRGACGGAAGAGAARALPPRRASTRARRGWSRRSARKSGGLGGIEDFLREYSLSTRRASP